MPIRNLWSLESGEVVTAEAIIENIKEAEVYFPLHDIGVDLLIVKGEKHVGIQVKESRYYIGRKWKSGHVGHSWHQIQEKKLVKSKADFYVFLTYLPVYGEHRISSFQNRILIVPKIELLDRVSIKDAGKRRVFSFCFHFEGDHVWDERVTVSFENRLADYSRFSEAWDLIKEKLG